MDLSQLDPMGAVERGQNMAMKKMQMDDMGQQRSLRQQAVGAQGGYTPEGHKELLMNAGFFEEAQDLDDLMNKQVSNKQQALERGLNIMDRTGQLVTKVGAPAWPMFRGSLIAAGLADEDSMPVEYDEQAAKIAQNFTKNSSEVFRIMRFRNGNQQQDIMNINGEITAGKPYSPGADTAFIKNSKYFAETMGMDEAEAAEYMSKAKEKSDSAVYQDLYTKALTITYGDEEEAATIANNGLAAVRKIRSEQRQPSAQPTPSRPQPVRRPGAEPKKLVAGKIYPDGNGNKARFKGGDPNDLKNWEPVP